MSVSSFKKGFVNPLIKKLEQERRVEVQGQQGQLLILKDIKAFIQVIKTSFPGTDISSNQANIALEAARKKALYLQNIYKKVNKTRFNAIVSKLPKVYGSTYTIGKDAFIVTNFGSSMNNVKSIILDSLESQGIITKTQKKDIRPKIPKGHGEIGGAVSEVEVAGSLSSVTPEEFELLKSNLDSYFSLGDISKVRASQISKVVSRYNMVVTKRGKLRADYFSTISFQVGSINTGVDAVAEREVKGIFKNFLENLRIETLEGSSTLNEKVERSILDDFISLNKNSNVKVRLKPNIKNAKLKSSGSTSVKVKPEKPRVKVTPAGTLYKPRIKLDKSYSLASLIPLFNSQLPQKVAQNMGSPALNYRTGRFASGVRVTNITKTAKGFPSIEYTYQKYPYQTFEPGYAQGTPERDPRKLINVSIREIAAKLALGRFYTRRV